MPDEIGNARLTLEVCHRNEKPLYDVVYASQARGLREPVVRLGLSGQVATEWAARKLHAL